MGKFSIVFKNSLQNKKTPLPQVALQQETGCLGDRLTVLNWCTTQPVAELALLTRSPVVVSFTPKASFIPECHFVELEVSAFRQGGCTLRQPRPSVLGDIQDVTL